MWRHRRTGRAPRDRAHRLNNEAKTAYEIGDYPKAITSFNKAYEAYPHAQILYKLGQVLAQFGNKELTAVGGVDAYIASIIPKL